jgi:60 kDa SS-A/Ro ribonucleoprotein
VVVVSMTAAGYTIADPRDEAVLQVAGLDAALPKLITGFIR